MSDIRIIAYNPDTHAVVPLEITVGMSNAGADCKHTWDEWRAMVSAAPPPPTMDVVKRLEFSMECAHDHGVVYKAETPFGDFRIDSRDEGARLISFEGVAEIEIAPEQSFAAAVVACQAEFNRLVSECLTGRVYGGEE